MSGRIKVSTSPYATVSTTNVTMFISPYTTALNSTGWSFDSSSGNLYSPFIDGEILKVACDYTSGASTSVWTLKTRDTPAETVLLVTGTDSDETVYPTHAGQDNTGSAVAAATNQFLYAVHGSLLCSCSGVAGEAMELRIYYR